MGMLRAYRELVGNRNLVQLLAGEFISSIGDWLYLVALLIVVYEESEDPVLLGIIGAARVLPYVLLSVPAGIVADRFDRRLVLLATDLVRGGIMVLLAILVASDGPLLAVVALAIVATCFSSFFGPAIGSYLPSLARDESQLGPANSAWATLDNLAFIIGPAVAGLLIAGSGLTLAFLLNAASFVFCAALLWRLPPNRAGAAASAGGSADGSAETAGEAVEATGGQADVRSSLRPLAGLLAIDIVAAVVFGGLGILTVVLASDTFGSGEEGTGYLNAAIGAGGLLGALISGPLVVRRRLAWPLLGGAGVLGAGLVALGLAPALGPAIVAMTVASAGSLVLEVVDTTIFQRVVPDAVRGRALGVMETVTALAYAGGSFALPVLSDSIGIGPVLIGGGLAIVAAGAAGVTLLGGTATREPAALAVPVARIAGLAIFTGIPAPRLEAILGRLRRVPVTAGTVVIREGDPADRFYVIDTGTFAVSQAGPGGTVIALRTMGPDEVFGEIGLLTGRPRSATVTATADGVLLALDGPDFSELVAAGPGLGPRLLGLRRGAVGPRRAEVRDVTGAVSRS